jgi:hypothetical protein
MYTQNTTIKKIPYNEGTEDFGNDPREVAAK